MSTFLAKFMFSYSEEAKRFMLKSLSKIKFENWMVVLTFINLLDYYQKMNKYLKMLEAVD